MWVRSAFWIGSIRPGRETEFAGLLDGALVTAMRNLPGVQAVRTLWPKRREDDPPELACQVIVEFADLADLADLELMLASAERRALRPQVLALREMFDGALSHIDCEVGGRAVHATAEPDRPA